MIFKLQRPLNNPRDPWLAYSEGRPKMFMIEANLIPSAVIKAMKGAAKAYFEATIENGNLVIDAMVDDQDW